MKHNQKTALGLVVALTVGAATALPAYAGGHYNHPAGNMGGYGGAAIGNQGAGMMGNQGAGMMGGQGVGTMGNQGTGMMGGQGGAGMGGQGGMMQMMQMMQQVHGQMGGAAGGMGGMGGGFGGGQMGAMGGLMGPGIDGEGLKTLLQDYDADGNGTLSIAEFEVAHSASIREAMVDRFQKLDNDGDGQITADEITALQERAQNMMGWRAQQSGEPKATPSPVPGPATGMGMGMGTQNSGAMQNQGN